MREARRIRSVAVALLLVAPGIGPAVARAGWSADPVTVKPTTAPIPLVEACSDGAYGTFVSWQEGSPAVLRAQHLLSTGDLDPAWPAAGALACSVATERTELVALPDRLGGVYLLWKEGATLYVKRLDASGQTGAGWPSRGRAIGTIWTDSPRPSVIEDGAQGFYAAWMSGSSLMATAIHLGPGNTGAGGWPNGPRTVAPLDALAPCDQWPQLALAPDGGIFVAWASFGVGTVYVPGSWRFRRLTSAGLNASGWPAEGLDFGEFHREYLGDRAKSSLLALSDDGRGGAWLMIGNPTGPYEYGAAIETRLYRLGDDSQSAPDWPAEGQLVTDAPDYYLDEGPDASYRVLSDSRDGVLVGTPEYYTEFTTLLGFARWSAAGSSVWAVDAWLHGYEIALRGDGGMFAASFVCCGPTSMWSPPAYIRVSQSLYPPGWSDFGEYHREAAIQWYGDIGLAPTGDGGVVCFWSQVRERFGLFARRFSPGGQVTAVEPERTTLALRGLRFVRGAGVRAVVALPDAAPARLELFDLAGRRVAAQAIEGGGGARELTLGGTAALPSGLYFARLISSRQAFTGRVVVAR